MAKTYLGYKGYTIVKNTISPNEHLFIRKELDVAPFKTIMGAPPSFPIYRESDSKFYVPRYFGVQHYGDPQEFKISSGDNRL